MYNDEILDELHTVREQIAASYNYDLDAMFEDMRRKQQSSGRNVVSFDKPREPVSQVAEPKTEYNKHEKQ